MDYSTWPRLIVLDVEGNGATPPDLVEFATVPLDTGIVQAGQAYSTLIRPPRPITWHATKVHGLTDEDVANAPTWSELASTVRERLQGAWIAAHNASVDHRVLAAHLPDWQPAGVIDTLRLSRAVYPEAPRHTLDAMITRAGIEVAGLTGQRHRASYDAHAAALLLLTLAEHYTDFDALAEVAIPAGLRKLTDKNSEEQTLW